MAVTINGQVAYVGRTISVRSYYAFEWDYWVATVAEDDGTIPEIGIGSAHIRGLGGQPDWMIDATDDQAVEKLTLMKELKLEAAEIVSRTADQW